MSKKPSQPPQKPLHQPRDKPEPAPPPSHSLDPQTPGGGHPPALASSAQSAPGGPAGELRSSASSTSTPALRSSDDDRTSADSERASQDRVTRSPLPPAGGAGGGLGHSAGKDPPLTPPASGRGTDTTNRRATPRQATSAVAHAAEPPAPDDPLLQFAPVPHKQVRRNSITPELQRKFIAHLAATGIVSEAARHIGKSMEAI